MFFTKLLPLLASLDLTFDIKQKEDKIRLIVKFKMQDEKSEQINLTPLVIEALPNELDEELIDELINHLNVSVPALSSQINLLTSSLKKVLEEKTKTATGKKDVKDKDEKTKKDEAPDLFETKEEVKQEPKKLPPAKPKATPPPVIKQDPKVEEVVKEEPKQVVSEQPKVESKKQEVVDLFAGDIDNDIVDKIELDKSEGEIDLFADEDDSDNPFA